MLMIHFFKHLNYTFFFFKHLNVTGTCFQGTGERNIVSGKCINEDSRSFQKLNKKKTKNKKT